MPEPATLEHGITGMTSGPLHETLVGQSKFIRDTDELISLLADSNLTVLITGETGTGKDIVARLLHRRSHRSSFPFVKVNCPALPHDLLESELFGYEKGAFTGARTAKPGRFELADKGTIFLDEIAEIPESIQVKLLQVLDGEPFMRIGGQKPVQVSTRIVAATNIPIDVAVREGRLRKDVSFRLNEFVVHMIPLRERPEDIPLLIEYFNFHFCGRLEKEHRPVPAALMEAVQRQPLRGNIRELAARVKEYVATGSDESLTEDKSTKGARPSPGALQAARPGAPPQSKAVPETTFMSLKEAARQAIRQAEMALIEEALKHTLWNRRKAAKLLRVSYSSLLRRIDAYEIGKS